MNATEMLSGSILVGVRPLCNVDENDESFDLQLIPYINGQIMMAHQFGIGYNGFIVSGTGETWKDWLGDDGHKVSAAITWLGLTVRQLFDPPTGGEKDTIQRTVDKMEYMLRDKSEREGLVQQYAPESSWYYEDRIAPETADED